MSESGYENLRAALSDEARLLAYVETALPEVDDVVLADLVDSIDASDFSACDWIESLILVATWLESEGLFLPVPEQIGYVSCGAEAIAGSSHLSHLPDAITEMLLLYGCERATKR